MVTKELGGRIAVVGCGKLGSALIDGILSLNTYPAGKIFIFDDDRDRMRQYPGLQRCANVLEAIHNASTIFLCIKPQDVAAAVGHANFHEKAVVSFCAGLTCADLHAILPSCSRLMRVMPNLALRVREAAIAYQAPCSLTTVETERVLNVLRQLGTVEAISEEQMDAATAVCGSGPAYFMMFFDVMARAAEQYGMDYQTGLRLAMQTARGAAALLHQGPETPEQFIRAVSSRGGTTEAAMKILQSRGVGTGLASAVEAAEARARELSLQLQEEIHQQIAARDERQ